MSNIPSVHVDSHGFYTCRYSEEGLWLSAVRLTLSRVFNFVAVGTRPTRASQGLMYEWKDSKLLIVSHFVDSTRTHVP